MAYQLSNGDPDGTVLGQSSADKVSFYGATAVVQPSGAAQAAVATTALTTVATTAATSTSPFGFTEVQANAIITAVNAQAARGDALTTLANGIRSALVTLGFIKGSA